MAFSGTQITRLGLSGTTRSLYGSFSGKTPFTGLSTYSVLTGRQVIVTSNDTEAPIELAVDSSGGVTGLTVTVAIRDPGDSTSYLDFNDGTFKTSAWTTKNKSLTEIGNGFYSTTLDISAITNFPATNHAAMEFSISGSVTAVAQSVLTLSRMIWNDQWALTLPIYMGTKF